MRVLIISQYFWPENFRINDITKILSENGIQVVVLTGCPNYPEGSSFNGYSSYKMVYEEHSDGYIINRVPILTREKASSSRLFLNYFSFVLSGIIFGSYMLRGAKYDLVFVYAPSPIFQAIVGIYFKYLKKAPLITWVQDLWPECIELTGHLNNKKILYLVSKVVSWIYGKNDLLLAQSRSFVSSIKMRAGSVPVQYFPNPGDDNSNQHYSIFTCELDEIFFAPRFNIVFAGNLGTVQSLPMILDAAEILRDCSDIHIILVGSGSLSQWLANEVQSRQLRNIFLAGRYPAEAMPAIFNCASALLVSLNSDPILNQTVPAKLQSYLAAGKPILASLDGEGAQIVVDAKAGITCPTEDPVALAHAILKLSKMSQDQLEIMGASGKRYFAENFEPQALTQELISIFAETISKA
jgi:glycosyltransferase involved in cell wall biosynthesis